MTMRMETPIDQPPGWERAAAAISRTPGVVLVLGGPDVGKSTFCRLVLGQALARRQPLAFIDGDLGQSHLGPPATLGLNLYPPKTLEDSGLFPETLYFIGRTSPPGAMLEVVVGLQRLAQVARSRGGRRILVNTSGFISGPLALRLKLAKAEALGPRLCLGLQRGRELEPILRVLREFCPEVLTLPVSGQARIKSYEARRLYRQERFARYWAGARPVPLALDGFFWLGFPFGQGPALLPTEQEGLARELRVDVLHAERVGGKILVLVDQCPVGGGETVDLDELAWVPWSRLENRLVGLLDARLMCLGLGRLLPSPWERRQVLIHTPLPPPLLERVKFCRLGKLQLASDGQELALP